MSDNKRKPFSRTNIIILVSLGFVGILSLAFIAAGSSIWSGRIKETVESIKLFGNVHCTSWSDAPSGYQSAIEEAANKVGIQPALLGAIFMAEHGDSIRATAGSNGIWARGGNAKGPFQIEDFDGKWSTNIYKKYSDKATGNPDDLADSALAAAAYIKHHLEDNGLKADGGDERTVKAAGMLYNRGPARLKEWKKMGFTLDKAPVNTTHPGWNWGAPYPAPNGPGYALRAWKNFQGLNNGCTSLASVTTSLIPNSVLCKVNLNLGYKGSSCGWVELPGLEKYYTKSGDEEEHWGKPSLTNILISVSKQWAEAGRPKLVIGEMSGQCTKADGHASHAKGIDADILLPGHMMNINEKNNIANKNYDAEDKQMMIDLGKILINCGATRIGYQDPDVIAAVNSYAIANKKPGRMVAWPKHKAHFHLRIEQY